MPKNHQNLISIIVPVYNGGDNFRRCLESIQDQFLHPLEVIIVDDGSTENCLHWAKKHCFKIIRLPQRNGPARARNTGALNAQGNILFFMDADVLLPKNATSQIDVLFKLNPNISAIIGSYDDSPAQPNFLSQYKNLAHHYIHQTSNENASTFWGGCGAIRREDFFSVQGFNESYKIPSIEDIELGYRLKAVGCQIRLLKTLQVKHLKAWGILSLVATDLFQRAIPWTILLLQNKQHHLDLNLKSKYRWSVFVVYIMLAAATVSLWRPGAVWIILCCLSVLFVLNFDFYRFFFKKKGLSFTVSVYFLHLLYYGYCGLGFVWGYLSVLFKLKNLAI